MSRKWLGALALAAAFAAVAFFLGRWQWHRYEAKDARAHRINAHYNAPPRPIGKVMSDAPLPLAEEWTRVTAQGRYAVRQPLLVRNRPWNGTYGYEVLAPFLTSAGAGVLVDRGWVANARDAAIRPDVPATPPGPVTVTGWVRPSEANLGRDLPAGQLASIDTAQAERQLGTQLLGGYVILQSEKVSSGQVPPRPQPLVRPDTDLGPHQAYALQWWSSMPVGFVLVGMGARREYLDQLEGQEAEGEERARQPRPKKIRVWDEEDA